MANDSIEHQDPEALSLSGEPIIEARKVGFAYGTEQVVIDASISLAPGSIGALIGANGSGKTTLLRLLAGLIEPLTGTVLYDGTILSGLDPRERAKRIAYVSQTSPTIFPFTALEVVLTGRSPYFGRFSFEDEKDRDVALAALASLDAAHLAGRRVTELSGGERQLVNVARALAQEPGVLLLDEPASSLDLKHRTQLTRALRRLRVERGIAILMVTHDLMLGDREIDVLFAMKHGTVIASGRPEMVLDSAVLGDVYGAPVHTLRGEGRIFVWSE